MDLGKLKIFHEVAKYGGVKNSVEKLGLQRPYISKMISILEKDVGVKLFVRSYRGMNLTDAGKDLYKTTKIVFRELELAENALDRRSQDAKTHLKPSTLSIGTSAGIASSIWFTKNIKKFREYNENCDLKIHHYSVTEESYETIDVFICPFIYNHQDLVQNKIHTFSFKLHASKAYLQESGTPKVYADLDDHKLIAFNRELRNPFDGVDQLLQLGRKDPDYRSPVIEVNNGQCLINLVKEGCGIGVLPLTPALPKEVVPVLKEEHISEDTFFSYKKKNRKEELIDQLFTVFSS